MSTTPETSSNRILVADDDPVIRHLVTTIVTRSGYTVVTVNDGDEAFRLLQRDSDFKAAIFDMMMPGLKGLDLLRFMRTEKRLLRIPVMMITSEKDLKLMTDLFAAGTTAILIQGTRIVLMPRIPDVHLPPSGPGLPCAA